MSQSPSTVTATEFARIRSLRDRGYSYRKIIQMTGRSSGTVQRALYGRGGKGTVVKEKGKPVGPAETGRFEEREDGTATASAVVDHPIRTLADAVAAAGVDLDVWFVDRWECTQWTVGMKIKTGDQEEVQQTQQYRVSVKLKRIVPRDILDALDNIYARLAQYAPRYPTPAKKAVKGEEYLGVLAAFDAHFGKLSWSPETGESYDLKIAEQVYANAVDDLIAEASGKNMTCWLYPIGNDHVHVDNHRNQTYNGTPQDVDGRYAKVIETAEMAAIRAVERMLLVAPVHVTLVPGNHDTTVSYHMARTIAAWFQKCPRVTVDYSPSPRKYFRWNGTLLGLTHGNEEKIESLPNLMAVERPKDWAETTCREWLLGHQHRSRGWTTKSTDTFEGTVIRVLRSIAGTDAWHNKRGYVNGPSNRAAEVYFYGKSRGYVGHAVTPARAG